MNNENKVNPEVNSEDYTVDIQFAENNAVDEELDQNPSSEEKRELLKKTKIVRQTWSIQEIYQKIKAKRLDLSPDYQRNVIWQSDKQSAFVESLFMGIIVPPIYVVEIPGKSLLDDSTYEVVDGKQRLTTINAFLTNKLKLESKSLEYYKDWFGGKTYSEIIENYQEITYEMLSSVLDIYVITANSPEFTKYDIFSRLNKGAEKLKVNEIRKAIYRSTILDIIDEFVKRNTNPENIEICERYKRLFSANDIKRYEDYGRFYTSIAFYKQSNLETHIVEGYNSRPRDMINNVLQKLQNGQMSIDREIVENILERTLELMEFMKDVDGKDYIINSCIPYAIDKWDSLNRHLIDITSDESIMSSVRKSASTTSNVNLRLNRVDQILNS